MFGLERAALFPIAGAWTAAAMLLTLLHMRLHLSWPLALVLTIGPATAVTVASVTLIQGKPPGYLTDWLQEHLLQQHDSDGGRRKPSHPLHAPQPRP